MSGDTGSSLRDAMYGENDLSSLEIFSGHFINFGYWRDLVPGGHISVDQRTESQADLYRTVLNRLNVEPTDVVLEIGCGIGVGAALALREYELGAVHGLDSSPDQLDRAARVNAELIAEQLNRLVLRHGSALALPYADNQFDKCYSVEAAQHFEDLARFAAEAHRVLKPGGRLAVTTFFLPSAGAIDNLRQLLDTVDNGIDLVVPIDSFQEDLLQAGFGRVSIENIGEHVWRGLDAWIAQTRFKDSWARNWLRAYERELIDYYLVTADKG